MRTGKCINYFYRLTLTKLLNLDVQAIEAGQKPVAVLNTDFGVALPCIRTVRSSKDS